MYSVGAALVALMLVEVIVVDVLGVVLDLVLREVHLRQLFGARGLLRSLVLADADEPKSWILNIYVPKK